MIISFWLILFVRLVGVFPAFESPRTAFALERLTSVGFVGSRSTIALLPVFSFRLSAGRFFAEMRLVSTVSVVMGRAEVPLFLTFVSLVGFLLLLFLPLGLTFQESFSAGSPLLQVGEKLTQIRFAQDAKTFAFQLGCSNTHPIDQLSVEIPAVDFVNATGGGILFQDGRVNSQKTAKRVCFFCSF